MLQPTYADLLRPAEKTRGLLYDALLVITGSLLMAALSQLSVNLPFSPVPITGQTLGVMLIGALMGWKRGAATILTYLTEGAAGLPFFAGGTSGVAKLAGPTGGYLIGFVIAAAVVGWLAERGWDRNYGLVALAMLIGNIVIYLFGVTWLANFVGMDKAPALGIAPFLIGDAVKIALAVALLPSGWKLLGMRREG